METVKLETESFLFDYPSGKVRLIPFYELSIDEWVIYENGKAKYLIDFNRRDKPLIKALKNQMRNGEHSEKIVSNLGKALGVNWTLRHNITVDEIPDSQSPENIELFILDDLSKLDLAQTITNKDEFLITIQGFKF